MGFGSILPGYKISTKTHCTYNFPSKVKWNHLSVDFENRCFDVFVLIVQMYISNKSSSTKNFLKKEKMWIT